MELFNTVFPSRPKNLHHNSLFSNAAIQEKTQKWQNLKQSTDAADICHAALLYVFYTFSSYFSSSQLNQFALKFFLLLEPATRILIVFRTNHAQFILKITVSVPQELRTHLHRLKSAGKLHFSLHSSNIAILCYCSTFCGISQKFLPHYHTRSSAVPAHSLSIPVVLHGISQSLPSIPSAHLLWRQ